MAAIATIATPATPATPLIKDSKPKKSRKIPILVDAPSVEEKEEKNEKKQKKEKKEKVKKVKEVKEEKEENEDNELITLTFGDAAENHKGMEQIGHKLEEGQGFVLADLQTMQLKMESLGITCELVQLSDGVKPEAHALVIKGGVTHLLKRTNPSLDQMDMFVEQKKLAYDKQAFMYGRVVNKHARWNLCFDDASRGPLYEEGKGTIVGYDEVPLMKGLRDQFGSLFGPKATDLKVESNYYYDTTKCGIGYHGDSERVKVIAMRIGKASMPMYYQWFYKGEPVGERIEIPLDAGDMYVMSEKAVGADWKKKNVYTLRHATGCKKFVDM